MSTPSDTKNLWTQYNGKGFSAKHAEYAERASTDVMGHDLTLTMANNQVTAIGGKPISAVTQITVPQEDDKLLISDSGNASWKQLLKSSWGTVLTAGDNSLADENGNLIFDENETELWTSFNDVGFGAERAVADVEGNNIIDTYAKKSELPDVSHFQQKLVQDTKTAAATVTVDNNKVTLIELASDHSISAMEITCAVAAGESANFAVEIDNKSASLDCVVTLVLTVGGVQQTIRLAASAAVAKANAGKYYQLTCVGTCWTFAEFA